MADSTILHKLEERIRELTALPGSFRMKPPGFGGLQSKSRRSVIAASVLAMGLSAVAMAQPGPGAGEPASPAAASTPSPENTPAVDKTPAPQETPKPTELEIKAYLSQSYSVNSNNPSTGKNAFRCYDFDDRKLKFDLFDLNFQYGLDKPEEVGFRVDLTAGQSMPRVDAALGLFRNFNTGVSNTCFDIRQAFLSYSFDNGVRLDLGKFATPFGYEIMDGVDGSNPNATRSWAFLYGPFTHTGGKLSYPICDQLTLTGIATLGCDQWRDANSGVSFGGQLAYKPAENLNFTLTGMTGPERLNDSNSQRRQVELTANWKVHQKINLGLDIFSGIDENFVRPGVDGAWNGVAVYMQNELADQFNLNFRYEAFNDPVGTRTGIGQHLKGFTITPEYRINDNWMVRMDVRWDTSDRSVFDHSGRLTGSQTTYMFNNVLRF